MTVHEIDVNIQLFDCREIRFRAVEAAKLHERIDMSLGLEWFRWDELGESFLIDHWSRRGFRRFHAVSIWVYANGRWERKGKKIEWKNGSSSGNCTVLPEIEWRLDPVSILVLLFVVLHVRCQSRRGIVASITKTALKSAQIKGKIFDNLD